MRTLSDSRSEPICETLAAGLFTRRDHDRREYDKPSVRCRITAAGGAVSPLAVCCSIRSDPLAVGRIFRRFPVFGCWLADRVSREHSSDGSIGRQTGKRIHQPHPSLHLAGQLHQPSQPEASCKLRESPSTGCAHLGSEAPKLVHLNILHFLPQRRSTLRLRIDGKADEHYAANINVVILQHASKFQKVLQLRLSSGLLVLLEGAFAVFVRLAGVLGARQAGRGCRVDHFRLKDRFQSCEERMEIDGPFKPRARRVCHGRGFGTLAGGRCCRCGYAFFAKSALRRTRPRRTRCRCWANCLPGGRL